MDAGEALTDPTLTVSQPGEDPGLPSEALALLACAAQGRMVSLSDHHGDSFTTCAGLISTLQHLQPTTLPLSGLCSTVQLLHCVFVKQQCSMALLECKHLLPTLLSIYSCLHTATLDAADIPAYQQVLEVLQSTAGLPNSKPCCCACHVLVEVLHVICRQCPQLVLVSTLAASVGNEAAQTPLLAMVQILKQVVSTSPSAIKPVVGWDGQLEGYTTGKQARDPCSPGARATHTTGNQSITLLAPSPGSANQSVSLLQRWLKLLAEVSRSHQQAARELYKLGVTSVLQTICSQFLDDQCGLVSAAQELWAWLAVHNAEAMDDMLREAQVHGLLGVASCLQVLAARQTRVANVVIKALGKLAEVVDGCSGEDFSAMVRPAGILKLLYCMLATRSASPCAAAVQMLDAETIPKHAAMDGKLIEDGRVISWFATCDRPGLAQVIPQLAKTHTVPAALAAHPARPAKIKAAPACKADRSDVDVDTGYDSDGLKEVYSSGPTPHQQAARTTWLSRNLSDKVSWVQTSDTLDLWLTLPSGTQKRELNVTIRPTQLTVSLSWAGRVLDGPLTRRVKASEATWVIERQAGSAAGSSVEEVSLHIMLPKDEVHFWRAVFEGAPERSHIEVLREAVEADEPVKGWEQLEPDARELVEEFRERQWMISQGHLDLENSFDDFRLAIGDSML